MRKDKKGVWIVGALVLVSLVIATIVFQVIRIPPANPFKKQKTSKFFMQIFRWTKSFFIWKWNLCSWIRISVFFSFQSLYHATIMLKISQLSREFIKWKSQEKRFIDEYILKNRSTQEIDNQMVPRTEPLVFDVPVVPAKITGIFQKSTNSLNFTALRKLVRRLHFKNFDPPK